MLMDSSSSLDTSTDQKMGRSDMSGGLEKDSSDAIDGDLVGDVLPGEDATKDMKDMAEPDVRDPNKTENYPFPQAVNHHGIKPNISQKRIIYIMEKRNQKRRRTN